MEKRAMAPKTERVKVEVTDSTEGETRTFRIIMTAPNSDFQLADLLRQRGVMSPINGELKQAVKVATQNYLSGAEALISTLANPSAVTPKTASNSTQKDRKASRTSQHLGSGSEVQQGSTAGTN
jgi:hypothetical protein